MGRRGVCFLLLLFVGAAVAPVPLPAGDARAETRLTLISDGKCDKAAGDEVRICGSLIRREDVVRLHALTDCIIVGQHSEGRTALSAYVYEGDTSRFTRLLAADQFCGSHGLLKVSPVLLAGMLAESLLKADFIGRHSLSKRPPDMLAGSEQAVDCLLRNDPPGVVVFLRSEPYSRKEGRALQALAAGLAPCLPKGETVRVHAVVLRAALALDLYAEVGPAPARPVGPTIAALTTASPRPFAQHPDLLLPQTPVLSISGTGEPSEAATPGMTPRDRADLPDRYDPSDVADRDSSPALDPQTGEATKLIGERQAREQSGMPYQDR